MASLSRSLLSLWTRAIEWDRFDRKWGEYEVGSRRAFPSNEEIFDRETVGMAKRGEVQDDWLPVSYSILDAGESMIRGLFGKEMEFLHRRHQAAFSLPEVLMPDYSSLLGLQVLSGLSVDAEVPLSPGVLHGARRRSAGPASMSDDGCAPLCLRNARSHSNLFGYL